MGIENVRLGRARISRSTGQACHRARLLFFFFVCVCFCVIGFVTYLQPVMANKTNRGVAYLGPGKVEVREIPYPKLHLDAQNRPCPHGAILKVRYLDVIARLIYLILNGLSMLGSLHSLFPPLRFIGTNKILIIYFQVICTNICGSDQARFCCSHLETVQITLLFSFSFRNFSAISHLW